MSFVSGGRLDRLISVAGHRKVISCTICSAKSRPPIGNTGGRLLHRYMVVAASGPSGVSSSEPAEHDFPDIGAVELGGVQRQGGGGLLDQQRIPIGTAAIRSISGCGDLFSR